MYMYEKRGRKGKNDARSWRQVDRTHQGSSAWEEKFDLKFYLVKDQDIRNERQDQGDK
jgi:hypothetical protein